jgi:hypothetical protein
MRHPNPVRQEVSGRRIPLLSLVLPPLLLCLIAAFLTTPTYVGDTMRYAADAHKCAAGIPGQFVEFGHLVWRPWAYLGMVAFGNILEVTLGDTPAQAAARFLLVTCVVFSVVGAVLLFFLTRVIAPFWPALLATAGFVWTNPYLNYSWSGSSYIPCTAFILFCLWCLHRALLDHTKPTRWVIAGAASYSLAIGLWFPAACVGLGMLFFLLMWNREDLSFSGGEFETRRRLTILFVASLAIITLLLFGVGAAAAGVHDGAALKQWIRESDNGWAQSITAVRLVTGLPRAVIDLGGDGVLLKRWYFKDPYNPVSLGAIGSGLGVKLLVFYCCIAVCAWALLRQRRLRAVAWIAGGAVTPLLLFAVVLFEPSSPERFLPALPFVFLAFAAILAEYRTHRAAPAAVVVLLAVAAVNNSTVANRWGSQEEVRLVERRIAALESSTPGSASVFVLTLRDPLYRVPNTRFLDRRVQARQLKVFDTLEMASARMEHWREEFGAGAVAAWNRGEDVWLSERLFATVPRAESDWVEGDDQRIRWADVPAFFRQLKTDAVAGEGEWGFRRLARAEGNAHILSATAVRPGGGWGASNIE